MASPVTGETNLRLSPAKLVYGRQRRRGSVFTEQLWAEEAGGCTSQLRGQEWRVSHVRMSDRLRLPQETS